MSKKLSCVALAFITLISLTILPYCNEQSAVEKPLVTAVNVEVPLPSTDTEAEAKNQAINPPEEKPEEQPETETQTQSEVQPETTTQSEAQSEATTPQPFEPSSTPSPTETPKPSSPTAPSLTKQSYTATDGTTLAYWLYTPENATDNMTLLIYLHGGSGKGDDLNLVLQNGFPKMLSEGSLGKIPAYIAIPQVSTGMKGWTDIKNSVRDLVNFCCKTYGTDSNRVSLTGHSMGGTGTWKLALAFPSLFSCIAPMSGSITTSDATIGILADMPIWAFVGSEDKIVNPDSSIQFINAIKEVNSNAQLTVFEGAEHTDVPGLAYFDEIIDFIQWLITQSK